MQTILFRTHADSKTGLGHLYRCMQLADQLEQQECQCIFLLDNAIPSIADFTKNHRVIPLYQPHTDELNTTDDAYKTLNLVEHYQATYLVVDDYRLDIKWETIIKQNSRCKLVVIDDLLRTHQCDVLLDYKYRGKNTLQAYNDLVPSNCHCLLGPKYLLLAEDYQRAPERPLLATLSDLNVVVSLGGAGTAEMYCQLIDQLLMLEQAININVIVGPLVTNKHLLEQQQFPNNVRLYQGLTNVYSVLAEAHLYIGTASGMLYQALALKIPSLTFSIATNQTNQLDELADLGHYFHLNEGLTNQLKYLPRYIESIIKCYPRVIALTQQTQVDIDGFGCQRVATALLKLSMANGCQTTKTPLPPVNNVLWQTANHQIQPIDDTHINSYLGARNLAANAKNMIEQKPIPRLSHYAWWFTTTRQSYLLTKDHKPRLYIWHEVKQHREKNFLIGGWFVCQQDIQFDDALIALNWQLEHCKYQYPKTPWLAVIHRQNNFVQLLNKYLGFEEITPESEDGIAIANLFPNAGYEHFMYVRYCPEK